MTDTIAEKTAARLARFSADERARFASVAEEVFGKPVSLAPESISDWETKDLQILYDVLGGMLLTKEHAPRLHEEMFADGSIWSCLRKPSSVVRMKATGNLLPDLRQRPSINRRRIEYVKSRTE
ncbi:hypothetical protein [Paenibacillus chitinolyticus]|uniref:hypothetical protein n=1 Tax=Paenibacillus chitinolyticus TaxID=79263 RepID=UPI003CFF63ED